jgi:hypothetical protein
MATSRDIYETLVGESSRMGVGELKDKLQEFLRRMNDRGDAEADTTVTEEDAEEFLREISDEIADEDEFAGDENLDDELEEDELDEDEDVGGLSPGETFEQIPGEDDKG